MSDLMIKNKTLKISLNSFLNNTDGFKHTDNYLDEKKETIKAISRLPEGKRVLIFDYNFNIYAFRQQANYIAIYKAKLQYEYLTKSQIFDVQNNKIVDRIYSNFIFARDTKGRTKIEYPMFHKRKKTTALTNIVNKEQRLIEKIKESM